MVTMQDIRNKVKEIMFKGVKGILWDLPYRFGQVVDTGWTPYMENGYPVPITTQPPFITRSYPADDKGGIPFRYNDIPAITVNPRAIQYIAETSRYREDSIPLYIHDVFNNNYIVTLDQRDYTKFTLTKTGYDSTVVEIPAGIGEIMVFGKTYLGFLTTNNYELEVQLWRGYGYVRYGENQQYTDYMMVLRVYETYNDARNNSVIDVAQVKAVRDYGMRIYYNENVTCALNYYVWGTKTRLKMYRHLDSCQPVEPPSWTLPPWVEF